MGQYYNVVVYNNNRIITYNRKVDGEYTMAKLMEHSWWYNPFVSSITKLLYENPCKVAWVGDYSEEINPKLYKLAWKRKTHSIHRDELHLHNKYLINDTKKVYLNCNNYYQRNRSMARNGWVIHPLPLLTSIGNGLGLGDYHGTNMDAVGSWSWDNIFIQDDIPVGYEELEYIFRED